MVRLVVVFHIGPDPEWASVVRSFISTYHERDALRLVHRECGRRGVAFGPVERPLVDLRAKVWECGFVAAIKSIEGRCGIARCNPG